MKTVKILHTADIHLGAAESFLGTLAENRRFETLITFEHIMDTALSEGVELVLIAGDLLDSNSVEDRFSEAVLSKIASLPIKVVFAAGNHDPLDTSSPFLNKNLPKNFYILGTKDGVITFEDINVKVYGRSFESAFLQGEREFTFPPEDDGYINILVQHGELKSDLNSDYNAITPHFVKHSKMDYIALGHIHTHTEIGRIDDTFFAYCGCPEGQGFDELDQKGVYIGEIGKGLCDLKFVSVSKRQHIHQKIDISGLGDIIQIAELILNTLKNTFGDNFGENLYKIELVGAVSPDTVISTAELVSRLSSQLYFVKVKNSTEISINLEELSKEVSLKGIFAKKMLEKISTAPEYEKDLYKKALQLGLTAFNSEVKQDED